MIIYIVNGWSDVCSSAKWYIKYMCIVKALIRFDEFQDWPWRLCCVCIWISMRDFITNCSGELPSLWRDCISTQTWQRLYYSHKLSRDLEEGFAQSK